MSKALGLDHIAFFSIGSLVRSKLARSVHICEANGFVITRQHHDSHSLQPDAHLVTRGVPKTDKEGNPLRIEVALSNFRDSQTVTLQEMPEAAPTGQLPRSVLSHRFLFLFFESVGVFFLLF